MAYKNILDTSFYDGRYEGTDGLWHYVPIDWSLAKTKWAGAIVKGSERLAQDPLYSKQVLAMKNNNVPYGSYTLFRADTNAIQAATKFMDIVEFNGGYGSLGIWVDAEYKPLSISANTYMTNLGSFMNELKRRVPTSVLVGIYSRNSFWEPIWVEAGSPTWTRQYPQWNARYVSQVFYDAYHTQVLLGTKPPVPFPIPMRGLGEMLGIQWTDKGKPIEIPGYPPYKLSVDFNLWDEKAFAIPTVPLTLEQRVEALEAKTANLEGRIMVLEAN